LATSGGSGCGPTSSAIWMTRCWQALVVASQRFLRPSSIDRKAIFPQIHLGSPCTSCSYPWRLLVAGSQVGYLLVMGFREGKKSMAGLAGIMVTTHPGVVFPYCRYRVLTLLPSPSPSVSRVKISTLFWRRWCSWHRYY
jgi:hypothetical protein